MKSRAFATLAAAHFLRGMGFWLAWIGMISLASFTLKAPPSQIALIIASTSIPYIILGPISGAIVDRTNPKWTLSLSFLAGACVTVLLVFATHVWQIFCIGFSWAAIGTLIWPAQGALIKAMVPEERLRRANGFIGACWEITLIAGPALSGLLAKVYSVRVPMAAGACLFFAGALVVATMPHVREPRTVPQRIGMEELREGLRVLFAAKELRVMATWGAFAWGGFNVLIAVEPTFVRNVLGGGAQRLGLMYSIGGIGSTTAALTIGWFSFSRRELFVASAGLAAVGFFFALYAGIARWPAVAPIQAFIGAGFAVYLTLGQSLIQRRAGADVVGRVIAAKRQVEESAGLIGSLTGGAIAGVLGSQRTLVGAGALIVVAAAVMMARGRRVEPAPSIEVSLALPGGGPLLDLAAPTVE